MELRAVKALHREVSKLHARLKTYGCSRLTGDIIAGSRLAVNTSSCCCLAGNPCSGLRADCRIKEIEPHERKAQHRKRKERIAVLLPKFSPTKTEEIFFNAASAWHRAR
jgi:hypothetical protein